MAFVANCGHSNLARVVTPKGRYCSACTDCEQMLAVAENGELWIVRDPKLTEEAKRKIEDDFFSFMGVN
jgi:hypothetical protein